MGRFCSPRVGSPLGVKTKAIAVLLLCCVLSLKSVLAYVRSVRTSPNRGVGLLSGFSTSLSFGIRAWFRVCNLGRTCDCLGRMIIGHVFV